MAKYTEDAATLLKAVGGKENIVAVTHCMTRMRFVLTDPAKADIKAIENISSIKGTFTQAGQFQVIIGNEVSVFYNDFVAHAGIEGVSKEAVKSAAKTNQTILQRVMGTLGEIFAPIIPALITGGLILGFRNFIGEVKLFNDGTQSLADLSQFFAGLYSFLWLIGEAIFHMLPVGIVWSITRKMGTTQILGIILGLTLVSPQLLNAFMVASTPNIPYWDFGFMKVEMIGYQGQVIAAMMAGFVLVYLERFFRKISPEVISMIVVPFCSLVPAIIIAHTIVGPIGWKIGDGIASIVYMGLTSDFKWIFAAIFGFLYAPVVMTGLHHMTNAIDSQLVNVYGGTILWPMIALSNIAQGSSVLAMSVLQRHNEKAQQVNIPALISCYMGVTEPALFGVNLKYVYPLICGMIGSSCAAMLCIGTSVEAFSIGVGGLPGILSIKPQFWFSFLICIVIAIAVPFTLTYIVGSRKLKELQQIRAQEAAAQTSAQTNATAANTTTTTQATQTTQTTETAKAEGTTTKEIKAPVSGHIIPLSQVPDQVFSEGILGDGVGIEPTGTTVLSPVRGTVSSVIKKSNHACSVQMENGVELLIHVGIDTVNMNGDGFVLHVDENDHVEVGDKLITFDPEKIKKAGYSTTTAFIVADPLEFKFSFNTNIDAEAAKTTVIRIED